MFRQGRARNRYRSRSTARRSRGRPTPRLSDPARDVGDAQEREDNGEEDADGAAFAPALVATRDAPTAPLRRVRHKAFGLGDVVRVIADGRVLKLEIAFASVGRKTVLASAVEDADAH